MDLQQGRTRQRPVHGLLHFDQPFEAESCATKNRTDWLSQSSKSENDENTFKKIVFSIEKVRGIMMR
jgi:hypothetical protein